MMADDNLVSARVGGQISGVPRTIWETLQNGARARVSPATGARRRCRGSCANSWRARRRRRTSSESSGSRAAPTPIRTFEMNEGIEREQVRRAAFGRRAEMISFEGGEAAMSTAAQVEDRRRRVPSREQMEARWRGGYGPPSSFAAAARAGAAPSGRPLASEPPSAFAGRPPSQQVRGRRAAGGGAAARGGDGGARAARRRHDPRARADGQHNDGARRGEADAQVAGHGRRAPLNGARGARRRRQPRRRALRRRGGGASRLGVLQLGGAVRRRRGVRRRRRAAAVAVAAEGGGGGGAAGGRVAGADASREDVDAGGGGRVARAARGVPRRPRGGGGDGIRRRPVGQLGLRQEAADEGERRVGRAVAAVLPQDAGVRRQPPRPGQ